MIRGRARNHDRGAGAAPEHHHQPKTATARPQLKKVNAIAWYVYVYTKPCICRFPGQGFSSSTKQRQKAAIPEAPGHTIMCELQCNLSVHPVRAAVRIQPHGAERRRKQKPNPKPEVHNLSVQRAGGVCKGLAGLGGNGEVDQCALKPRRNN